MGCILWGFGVKLTTLYRHRTACKQKRRLCYYIGTLTQHYGDVIMGAVASQITSLTIVYSTDYSDADQRKHQSSASLAFVWGIHRGPVNSPHKWPVTGTMFPFDYVIMITGLSSMCWSRIHLHVLYLLSLFDKKYSLNFLKHHYFTKRSQTRNSILCGTLASIWMDNTYLVLC